MHATIMTVAIALLMAPLAALAGHFTEDFTSTAFRDPAFTTADWDTVTGGLHLPAFVPTVVGTLDTPGATEGVAIAGGRAYLADGQAGLRVIDLGNPASPTSLGALDTPGYAYALAVDGAHAFIADGSSGLRIVDVSDPAAPALAGVYATPGQAYGVAVDGDLAIVADHATGILIVDVSDVTAPGLLGSLELAGTTYDVAIDGDVAFVTAQGAGLHVLDISDPAAPALLATLGLAGQPDGVAASGDVVYVAGGNAGLHVVDVSDPSAPVLLATLDTPGFAIGVHVDGDLVHVADGAGGLLLVDVMDPSQPQLRAAVATAASTRAVALGGELAFLAEQHAGLRLIQVRAVVQSPALVGQVDTPGHASGLASTGDLALLADGGSALRIFDISDPTTPTLVGSYTVAGNAVTTVAVAGNLALAGTTGAGVLMLDITDPASPVLLGILAVGDVTDILVAGDLAFITTSGDLWIADISDPATPVMLGSVRAGGLDSRLARAGDLVAVGWTVAAEGQVALIDISDPQTPTVVGEFGDLDIFLDLALDGDRLYVTDYSGLIILDVADPANPSLLGTAAGLWRAFAVSGDRVILGGNPLTILDVSEPTHPVTLASAPLPGAAAGDLAVAGEHALVARGPAGLDVHRIFQHEVIQANDVGRSRPIDMVELPIVRTRLVSDQAGAVSWAVSNDGGTSFQPMVPGDWARAPISGNDLVWQATLGWTPSLNPRVEAVTLAWLGEAAAFTGVSDVPDDQGGWVRVGFARSGYDFVDEADLPITGYQLYRRVDDAQLSERIRVDGQVPDVATLAADRRGLASFAPDRLRSFDGAAYVLGGSLDKSGDPALGSLPSGTWQALTWVAALQQDQYLVEAHTAADSTADAGAAWSVFLTTAHTTTPAVWFAAAPDSGYSIDNIAPAAPADLVVDHNPAGASLSWQASEAADFAYFNIYRGASPDVPIDPAHLVHRTVGTSWDDPDAGDQDHYRLTAVDAAGNEGDPAAPDHVTAIAGADLPSRPSLRGAYPNPFNPATEIRFALPVTGAHVELNVYDSTGRLVTTLVDAELPAGEHAVAWRGTDDRGRPLASGVYLYRLRAGDTEEARKMSLVK